MNKIIIELISITLFVCFGGFLLILLIGFSNKFIYMNDNLILFIWVISIITLYQIEKKVKQSFYGNKV